METKEEKLPKIYPVNLIWQIAIVNIIIVFILSNFEEFMTSTCMLFVLAGLVVGDMAVIKLVELVRKERYKWKSIIYAIIPCEFIFVFTIITLIRNSLVGGNPSVPYKNATLVIIYIVEVLLIPYAVYMFVRLNRHAKENEELEELRDLEFKPESQLTKIFKKILTVVLVVCFIVAVVTTIM